ncbi:DUF2752 domain-containing protein [Mycolicibacterium moriokaense]|uniref:Uncharacterized protein DUF2752 n=1 Tax=Mycolicibacterium moriokaense TaxID=39691 RepID=A0A318HD66_9MYCO|nr:DUF2752 domain-containing protein [Mycolicibacterium moriokaense]PXX06274.1 uncharacterized protein DUF2752 [Mycolicibacterium moriokaense]
MRTRSEDSWPTRLPSALVQRRDAYPMWTWIALIGLVIAVLLAVLGLPPVDLHGPLHYFGVMDPLCGGTRSVYLTMHGQLRVAVRYNPAGPALLAGAVAVLIRAGVGRSTGYWVGIHIPKRILIPMAVAALAALEVNQQLHAVPLTQPWGGS